MRSVSVAWLKLKSSIASVQGGAEVQLVSAEAVATSDSEGSTLDISLPTLLLDSEVIYSRSAQEAIGNILRQQMTAHTVSAFGGFTRSFIGK